MTVRDLLSMEIDIDVYADVTDELGIAFVGPMKLTKAGLKKFGEVLDYKITLNTCFLGQLPAAIVHVDDADDVVLEARLSKAKELFESAAGFCSVSDYKAWFIE